MLLYNRNFGSWFIFLNVKLFIYRYENSFAFTILIDKGRPDDQQANHFRCFSFTLSLNKGKYLYMNMIAINYLFVSFNKKTIYFSNVI